MRWLFFLLLLIYIPAVSASGISISPSAIQLEIYRGETAESAFVISNPSDEALNYRISIENNPDWYSFSKKEGTLQPGKSAEISLKASPPLEAQNGEYLTFITVSLEPEEEKPSLSLSLAAAIKAKLIISGKQVVSLSVGEIAAKDTEQGLPIQISAGLSNDGNVRISPAAEITLRKNSRLIKKTSEELSGLAPGSNAISRINLTSEDLEPGNYTATAKILLGNRAVAEKELDFMIYPYGTFSRSGKFQELSLDAEPKTGKTSKLTGKFQNTGSIALKAQLISEIYKGDRLMAAAESDELLVQPGETAELVSYFRPDEQGDYKILSRVSYGGKTTETRQLSFNIPSAPKLSAGGIIITASIIIMGLMLYYGKEVWKMVGKKIEGKVYYCIDCNRPIKHKGRCMLCNVTARKRLDAQEKKYAN